MSTLVYCTLDDLKDAVSERRLVEATDDTDASATGQINTSKVDAAIATAGDLIDGYVGKRYPLPLPMIPEILRGIAVDLALYKLYSRVRDMDASDGLSQRRKEAIRMLEQIADNRISLGLSITDAAPAPVDPIINSQPSEFSGCRLDRMERETRGGRTTYGFATGVGGAGW